MSDKVYIAGPMTGHPKFNFPAFDKAAADLRRIGFEVVSPAELDDPDARAAALASEWGDPAEYAKITGLTWADFLSRDVKLIADGGFTAIICLPGWRYSRGARLETFVGYLNGVNIMELTPGNHIQHVTLGQLLEGWGNVQLDDYARLNASVPCSMEHPVFGEFKVSP